MVAHDRVILASNRLPVTVQLRDQQLSLEQSGGGLATGLKGLRERSLWIGWPGEAPSDARQRAELDWSLGQLGTRPIYLTRTEQKGFYEDFSNGVLWPVLHEMIDHLPPVLEGWSTYERVNERFARAIAENYRRGDVIWVHDYHLLLVPQMVRDLIPRARIGFFLHIPFPARELFRVIPQRKELLAGLLGADLIGFHTQSFADNFSAAACSILGLRATSSGLRHGRRAVRVGAFPMGVDTATWEARGRSTVVAKQVLALMQDAGKRKIIVGIDRLDYTKGLPRRIAAIESLLQEDPALADRIRFIQISFPSRERIETYAGLRRQVNETVGRINAAYGTPKSVPIHLINRSLSEDEVSALYCAADVMLVTPLRDGMNLVAKEFVASRLHGDGVLILSEFAGAAAELNQALLVNPYDREGVVEAIKLAIEMPSEEQRARMAALRETVTINDVHHWSRTFISALAGERNEDV
jgi:trehalose 6-phosphate synthase/phosphatase